MISIRGRREMDSGGGVHRGHQDEGRAREGDSDRTKSSTMGSPMPPRCRAIHRPFVSCMAAWRRGIVYVAVVGGVLCVNVVVFYGHLTAAGAEPSSRAAAQAGGRACHAPAALLTPVAPVEAASGAYWSLLQPVEAQYWRPKLEVVQPYIRPNHAVVDFGAGGGEVLSRVAARAKVGVELMPEARRHARAAHNLTMVADAAALAPASQDVAYMTSALVMVRDPLAALCALHRALRPGGTLVVVALNEARADAALPFGAAANESRAFHLYAWTPRLLGNLGAAAGFAVQVTELWQDHVLLLGVRPPSAPPCEGQGRLPTVLPPNFSATYLPLYAQV